MLEGRYLGLDVGSKTIGVAISDALGWMAQGHSVIRRRSMENDLEQLAALVEEYQIIGIVVGLPKNMNNSLGAQADVSMAFADMLRERFSMEVVLWDERLTSSEAKKRMQVTGTGRAKQKQIIDQVAAEIILSNYLDFLKTKPSKATL